MPSARGHKLRAIILCVEGRPPAQGYRDEDVGQRYMALMLGTVSDSVGAPTCPLLRE